MGKRIRHTMDQIILARHTEPDPETALLLHQLGIALPPQPPPEIHHNTPIPTTPL